MKKLLLLTGALALSIATMAQVAVQPKWDFTLERMMQSQTATRSTGSELTSVRIEVTDAEAVMSFIQEAGFRTTFITERLITAVITIDFVEQLAAREDVVIINGPKIMRPTLDQARAVAGIDDIHNNATQDFETPFTGKGVIVGIIDQGFQYRHAAFMDKEGNSRVISFWNREIINSNTQPTTTIPKGGQNDQQGGHGSHVAGIAVGSVVENSNFHGVAPEADIIIIPSAFDDNEILEDVAHIKEVAKTAGKPYVINMSFGYHLGPHDGSGTYNQGLNDLVADNSGVFVCAAGNDGDAKLHASHVFTEENEVRYLFIDQSTTTANYCYLSIWEQTADGAEHVTIEPCCFQVSTGKVTTIRPRPGTSTTVQKGIDPITKKQNFEIENNFDLLTSEMKGAKDIHFGIKITSKKGGANVHVWNNSNLGEFCIPDLTNLVSDLKAEQFIAGDYDYLVMDGGTAEKAITVASYNSGRYQWVPYKGSTSIGYPTYQKKGEISAFSSQGPVLTPNVIKPTVAAPGAVIISALNRYSNGFKESNSNVHAMVEPFGEKSYYGAMQGTSMSAPFVSGVIALWYQANPQLTHEQIMTIIKETAINDEHTLQGGQKAWGYGKINAYDGLKMALKLASSDGINDMQNSEAPVSFQKGNNAWRILFNNNESYANIRVTDLNGRIVAQQSLEQLKCGDETSVSLNSLPAGVYLINVATTKANITRKVMKN